MLLFFFFRILFYFVLGFVSFWMRIEIAGSFFIRPVFTLMHAHSAKYIRLRKTSIFHTPLALVIDYLHKKSDAHRFKMSFSIFVNHNSR